MVIRLVHLLSLISIASTTVVSRSNSQGKCPVWFKRNENGTCECGFELGGKIKCDPYKQVVSIMVGYCMSFDNSSQELVVGFNNDRCLGRSMNSHPRGFSHIYRSLSTDIAKLEELCSVTKQKGLLCGECRRKYGPSFNSLCLTCIDCNMFNAILMILLIVFLMTVFYVIVIIFRLNFTSGAMLGYTIFCQVTIAVLRSNVGIFYSLNDSLGSFGGGILRASMGMGAMWCMVLCYSLPSLSRYMPHPTHDKPSSDLHGTP